ncbi:MAG: uroporphyrinogen-III synthase [Bradyrhizobiaceae bacterium]|jgi:uroporphyrinogen-III synthase|uniref:uroporphyrinogen-III synthase n=2 Tax=Afipia TaxID=1033 RepID=UPI0001DA14C7|nr:uroporphyrinogen-III synthase [Afipia sp. 1NLS2]EFI52199.1 Uroporphyrinogen III synthase HEM4 [Afipia sp. 1NLS2]RTL73441.1 MAG: uroporphyrinogen-III synthase [Bradyrhizobiaceae bacterium]
MAGRLSGYRILILETREEAQFSRLLRDQGADVLQCPMFTIEDTPDQDAVGGWIKNTIHEPLDDLVLMTGEGVRRLVAAAKRIGLENEFIAALARPRKYARGPKPVNALRQIGLTAEMVVEPPTTEGIIATLSKAELKGHRVGLQLYPEKDHSPLLAAVREAGATPVPVEPYVYDARAAQPNIAAAIGEIAAGRVDAIALTSSGQVRRLVEAARAEGSEEQLRLGLAQTPVASIGPVVSNELKAYGLQTDISPANGAYFMKPLIQAITARLTKTHPLPH